MGPSLQRVSAMSLFVEDVQGAETFYREVFAVPVIYKDEVSAALKFDNLVINLLQASEASELGLPGEVAGPDVGSRAQLSIWVQDVDAVCEELERRGVTLISGPIEKPWGMRVATFVDPAGHSWEVAQRLES